MDLHERELKRKATEAYSKEQTQERGTDWVEPLFDRVVVELPPLRDKTEGGLFIPEAYLDRHKQLDPRKIKPLVGRVIAVGPGGLAPNGDHLKMMVSVGDTVIMHNSPTVGIKHTMDGKDVLIIGQYDLIAKVPDSMFQP